MPFDDDGASTRRGRRVRLRRGDARAARRRARAAQPHRGGGRGELRRGLRERRGDRAARARALARRLRRRARRMGARCAARRAVRARVPRRARAAARGEVCAGGEARARPSVDEYERTAQGRSDRSIVQAGWGWLRGAARTVVRWAFRDDGAATADRLRTTAATNARSHHPEVLPLLPSERGSLENPCACACACVCCV